MGTESALIRVMDIAFEPAPEGSGIVVRFKGIPAYFAPKILDGMTATLCIIGAPGRIRGVLTAIPDQGAPRGMWFAFRFTAEDARLAEAIRFEGLNRWSPIVSLEIVHCGQRHSFHNPFART